MSETSDASVRVIAWAAATVAGGVAAVLGISWLLWSHRPAVLRPLPEQRFSHGPADRPDAVKEWPAISSETQTHLTTYGWVDRSAGVVRIPIDQAMARLAASQ